MLWLVELRKHLPLFGTVSLVTTSMGAVRALNPDVLTLQVIQALCVLLCWTATTIYSASVVFAFLTLGRDLLLHLSTRSRWQLAGVKLSVLAVLLLVQHALTLVWQVADLSKSAGPHVGAAIGYVVVAKIVSILVFLCSVTLVATLAKKFRGRGGATTFFASGMLVVVAAQAIVLWRIGAPNTHDFFIGVGGDVFTVNLYANILPLTLTGPGDGFLPPITGLSILLNLLVAVTLAGTWAVSAKVRKFDFLPL